MIEVRNVLATSTAERLLIFVIVQSPDRRYPDTKVNECMRWAINASYSDYKNRAEYSLDR